MENYKKIVYRNEDEALVIEPQNSEIEIKVNFLGNLDPKLSAPLFALKEFCETKIDTEIKYVVAYRGTNLIEIEDENSRATLVNITELNESETKIVADSILACLEILNS